MKKLYYISESEVQPKRRNCHCGKFIAMAWSEENATGWTQEWECKSCGLCANLGFQETRLSADDAFDDEDAAAYGCEWERD